MKDSVEISKYINEAITALNDIDDTILRELKIKELSTEFGIDESVIKNKLKEPIKVNGKQSDLYATVTYVFGNRALVDNRVTDKYEVIISDEFLANISSYGSDIHEEYRDKSELYQAVFKQLAKNKGLNM